jgi:hypothetical protein
MPLNALIAWDEYTTIPQPLFPDLDEFSELPPTCFKPQLPSFLILILRILCLI